MRVEDPEVFDLLHDKVLQLVGEGVLDGLRVDHPDGLADPAGYLQRLRDAGVEHVWVEKILHRGREPELLRDWPVDGHGGLRVPQRRRGAVRRSGGRGRAVVARARPAAVRGDRARGAGAAGDDDVRARGRAAALARVDLDGIAEALAALPIYRTYVQPGSVAAEDVEAVDEAGIEGELRDALLAPSEFVTRFQQTSPPVTAKGIEDTAFYRDLRCSR